jgi:hypothetical protein
VKKIQSNFLLLVGLLIFLVISSGCSPSLPAPSPTPTLLEPIQPAPTETVIASPTDPPTPTQIPLATNTAVPSHTSTNTPPPSPTAVATETPIPTETATPTITPSPTFAFPQAVIQMQANCRYGPGTAYLYSHGLYDDDDVEIHGRTPSGTWLWIQPENLERHCWAAASVMEISGDIFTVKVVEPVLPRTTFAGPPQDVNAIRDGEKVTVSWTPVQLTEDKRRGYLIEAWLCQNGQFVSIAVHTNDPFYEFFDGEGCSNSSGGRLYTAEKHGYSDPVPIPWP